jgi:hypothetical protein
MPLPLGLAEGDKFAVLGITNIGTEALRPQALPDSTAVALGIPVEIIDEFWHQSLGSIAIEALRRCNLLLLRRAPSAHPGVLDAEHEALAMRTVDVFWLLQLSGVPYYEGAVIRRHLWRRTQSTSGRPSRCEESGTSKHWRGSRTKGCCRHWICAGTLRPTPALPTFGACLQINDSLCGVASSTSMLSHDSSVGDLQPTVAGDHRAARG